MTATAAVAAFALAVFVAIQELAIFEYLGKTSNERFHQIIAGSARFGLSLYSKNLALDDCYNGMGFLQTAARPDAQNQEFAERCLAISQTVLTSIPTLSYAWVVSAVADMQLGATEKMNDALVSAQHTGPTEFWLAERRMILALNSFSTLDERAREASDMDLKTLLNSWKGRKALARRYAQDPAFRPRITKIALALDESIQKEFLYAVSNVAKGSTFAD